MDTPDVPTCCGLEIGIRKAQLPPTGTLLRAPTDSLLRIESETILELAEGPFSEERIEFRATLHGFQLFSYVHARRRGALSLFTSRFGALGSSDL